MTAPRLRLACLLFLATALIAIARDGGAHELLIDQISLFKDPTSARLRAQLSFDPELTRSLRNPPPSQEARRRVASFVKNNLQIQLDDKPCPATIEVRELYDGDGSVPGDIVMLTCPLPARSKEIRVALGDEFKTLVVSVAGFSGHPGDKQSVVLRGGETSPAYTLGAELPAIWREGGAEQFAPGASARSVPQRSARPTTSSPRQQPSPASGPRVGFTQPGVLATFWHTLGMGYTHILPGGWDHVLFVAGLVLGAGQHWRRLVLELSLFTLAHTLTLGLGALGWLLVSPHIVEPLIAVSIAYVAAENLLRKTHSRRRLWVVFGFGLVHGQGFAGALSKLALESDTFLSALLGFNLGVEAGQITVAAALSACLLLAPHRKQYHLMVAPLSFVAVAVSCYWVLERVVG